MIQPVQTNSYSPAKKAVKTVATVAATAGLAATVLAVGARKGAFGESANPILKKINPKLQTAGNFIADKAETAYKAVKGKMVALHLKEKLSNNGIYKKAKAAKDTVVKKFKSIDVAGIKKSVVEKFTSLKDKFTGVPKQ